MRAGLLAAAAVVMLHLPVAAYDGLYRVQGEDPSGIYAGRAAVRSVALPGGRGFQVRLAAEGARRVVASGRAVAPGELHLRASSAGLAALVRERDGRLLVAWRDEAGQLVRREVWTQLDEVEVEVAVVGVTGDGESFATLTEEETALARRRILARLSEVYAPLGVAFRPLEGLAPIDGRPFDRNLDGVLSARETEDLRDALERRGVKRPGRVVLAVTRAPFVSRDCRGWTLGDAPPTPATLEDVNDNFSLVGVEYTTDAYHTVPHEVGHQLGLDDIRSMNRPLLVEPGREDHLMISGGEGVHLDPTVVRILDRLTAGPDHGLTGRRIPSTHRFAVRAAAEAPAPPAGLEPPPAPLR